MFFFPFLIVFVIVLIAAGIGITIRVMYCLTLSRMLKLCHPQNQKITPGEVWMLFIPLFGLVWHFILIGRLADTLAAEFYSRNIPRDEERPGYQTGLWALILLLVPFASIVGFIFWIMYWVKISNYKKQLEQSQFQFGTGNPFAQPNQYPPNPYPPQFSGHNSGGTDIHL